MTDIAAPPSHEGATLTTQRSESPLSAVTGTGWVALVVGLAGLLFGVVLDYRELVGLGIALLLALVVAGVWMSLRPILQVGRTLSPGHVVEGEPSTAILTVRNLGQRRTTPMLIDEAFNDAMLPVAVDSLGGGESSITSYALPTAKRGRYMVGPLRIAHTDPLRLMRVGRAQGAVTSLFVLPRTHSVSPLPTGRIRDLEGMQAARTAQGGITFHTLREYVPGDDLRLVHWKSVARTGKLMVRHNVVTYEPRFSLMLDTWAGSYDNDERFEAAVRVIASLVESAVATGHELSFFTTGGLHGSIDASGNGMLRVSELLAEASLSDDDPSLRALAKTVDTRKQPVSLGIVTGEPRSADAEVVARAGARFDSVSVVQLAPAGPPLPIGGALVVRCETSEDFVDRWKQRVG